MIEEVVLGRDKEALEVRKYIVYVGNDGYLSLPGVRYTVRTGK